MHENLSADLEAHIQRYEQTLERVRRLLVEQLRVPLPAEQIELAAPLFGTGLGLDSVDAVELVIAVESEFGIRLPEGTAGPAQFRTVHSLIELVLNPPVIDAPAALAPVSP